ncbi:MAG: NeuD/PglB/VioB family sugar acetyltransferase [Myxococcales bacterium]|nr:NeuD/PglB/VioB family sugar acetyltransferase [Myxococcales bacterium]
MDLVIVGAGGFGREVFQHALDARKAGAPLDVIGFLDDRPDALEGFDLPVGVLGSFNDERYLSSRVVIALGDQAERLRLREAVSAVGGELVSVIHPTAYVAESSRLGVGLVIGPGVYIGINASVGDNAAFNVYSSVGHDAMVGRDGVLSSYSAVTGSCAVGDGVFTGTHVTISPGVTVGGWSKVAAGSVVTRDCPPGSLLVGNPAKGRVMFPVSS